MYQGAVCVESHIKKNTQTHTTREQNDKFLGTCPKFRKTTVRFVMSVRLFVRPSVRMEHLGSN